jgi:phosphoribosyl 1,2-cyclic phosphate phosphodiesterase
LREQLTRVDAVLYTHTHADHIHGIDDLRAFCQRNRQQIPLYAKQDAVDHIMAKFGYAIRAPSHFWDLPVLSIEAVEKPFTLLGQTITPIPVVHGRMMIYGYRIGNMAYLTDVSAIPETSFPLLQGLELLLIDCLRHEAHPTHVNLEQSLALVAQIGAKQSVMIHMTHELEYETLSSLLPSNVYVGYDGLKLNFS